MDESNHHQTEQVSVIRKLTKRIPVGELGLPVGFYRADLLPFHNYDPTAAEREEAEEVRETAAKEELPHAPRMPTAGWSDQEGIDGGGIDGIEVDEPESSYAQEYSSSDQSSSSNYLPVKEELDSEPEGELPQEYRVCGFVPRELEDAFVWLNYDEGFPSLETGIPFWGRLEYEPNEAFGYFVKFLALPQGVHPALDARVEDGSDWSDEWKPAGGTRSIHELASQLGAGYDDVAFIRLTEKLRDYAHLYYWGWRSRAYDMYRVAQHRQQQERRAIETQDSHYVLSQRLRARLMTYMNDEEMWETMTPKTAIDMLKTITTLERISAGLPASSPLSEHRGGDGAPRSGMPTELIFRQIARDQQQGMKLVAPESEDGLLLNEDGESVNLDKLLREGGEDVAQLQEFILRFGS